MWNAPNLKSKTSGVDSLHMTESTVYSTVTVWETNQSQLKHKINTFLWIYLYIYIYIFVFAAKVCDHVCHIVALPGTISDWDWFPPSADVPNWLLIIGAHANKVRREHNPRLQSQIIRSKEKKNPLTFKYDRSCDLYLCSWRTRSAYRILFWSLICSG